MGLRSTESKEIGEVLVAQATMTNPADYCVAVLGDDESFCHSVRRWLNAFRFVPAIYHAAEEFLADPYNERFACLLVGTQLRGMTGLELQRRLTLQDCRTPVIYVATSEDPLAIANAESAGCIFLHKTVNGEGLMHAIRGALAPRSTVAIQRSFR